jgi:uroporphyrinogen-III synthase
MCCSAVDGGAPADLTMLTLVVTRPEPQAADWVARLQAHGASALALPLLRIVAAPDSAPAVAQAWRDLAAHRLLMFVSPNAVAQFFAARPSGAAWPADVLAGATGPGTQAALAAHGVPVEQIAAPRADAPSFDAEALWRDALAPLPWAGRRVLVVRGDGGRDWLADTLRAAGAEVTLLCTYRQLGPAWDDTQLATLAGVLARPAQHVWLFSSSQAVRHLARRLVQIDGGLGALRGMAAIASHERIAASALALGLAEVHRCAPRPAAVLAVLEELRQIVSGVTKLRR